MVADEAHLVGQVRLLGVADGRRHARVGDGDHDVGRDGALARELAAERLAHLVDVAAEDAAVGAREVDVLEDAGVRLLPGERVHGVDAALAHGDDLARLDLALVARVDQVEGAGLGGDDHRVTDAPEDERAEAARVARGDDPILGEEDQRVGALHLAERVGDALRERGFGRGRDQVDDDLAVDRRLEDRAARLEPAAQLVGVHEVAVVRDGERALGPLDHERLAVLEHGRAAGRVAVVADGEAAPEAAQDLLVEDLRHVAHAAVADEGLPVRGHDARRLLPPVLEGVEAQVRERRRLRMAEDADHAALLVELVEHPPAAFTLADAARQVYC